MAEIDEVLHLHRGTVHLAVGVESVTITANGSNESGDGDAETTVTF